MFDNSLSSSFQRIVGSYANKINFGFVKSSDRAHKICYGMMGTGIDLNGIAYVIFFKLAFRKLTSWVRTPTSVLRDDFWIEWALKQS